MNQNKTYRNAIIKLLENMIDNPNVNISILLTNNEQNVSDNESKDMNEFSAFTTCVGEGPSIILPKNLADEVAGILVDNDIDKNDIITDGSLDEMNIDATSVTLLTHEKLVHMVNVIHNLTKTINNNIPEDNLNLLMSNKLLKHKKVAKYVKNELQFTHNNIHQILNWEKMIANSVNKNQSAIESVEQQIDMLVNTTKGIQQQIDTLVNVLENTHNAECIGADDKSVDISWRKIDNN